MFRSISARSSALFALAALTAGLASAQNKFAVINLQRAVLESAEIKKASNELEAKYKPRQADLERIQKELAGIQNQLQTMAGKLTQQAEAELTICRPTSTASGTRFWENQLRRCRTS
jgi:outer membrane protein